VRAGLNEDTVFEARRREDGVIELHPHRLIPQSQAWFWTERWQELEREADAEYAAGRFKSFATPEEFLAELERIAAEEHPCRISPAEG
jgi:hypothetical protein